MLDDAIQYFFTREELFEARPPFSSSSCTDILWTTAFILSVIFFDLAQILRFTFSKQSQKYFPTFCLFSRQVTACSTQRLRTYVHLQIYFDAAESRRDSAAALQIRGYLIRRLPVNSTRRGFGCHNATVKHDDIEHFFLVHMDWRFAPAQTVT